MNSYCYTVILLNVNKLYTFKYIFILGKNNKVEEAMSLWTQMQEEDIQPSDHFMWTLSELLKQNNLEVPFTVNKPLEKDIVPSDFNNTLFTKLDLYINNNNLSKTLALRKTMLAKGLKIYPTTESKIIELLVRENKLNEAFEITKSMLENGRPISKNILNFLVGNLSDAGNIANLEYLNEKLSKV